MGKVEGGMKCVKYLLFVFNFIFWLMGSFVLAVGLWLRFDPETVSLLSGEKAPDTFFIGEHHSAPSSLQPNKIIEDVQNFYAKTYNENSNGTLVLSYQKVLSCCGTIENRCPDAEKDTRDCETGIKDFFNSKLFIVGYVGIGIAGVMIIGMIFSMVLCCAIRNSREVI
ncbi:tetraspanin-2-like [Neolamprologus brichardi]|uniref:tetraspanin-2-like n=1 Tax=Neolamprologus brichardi TaxID=32507 RepID=UPI001643D570|nr:tetraspanin-2-like [Neolamprologus brichardi]